MGQYQLDVVLPKFAEGEDREGVSVEAWVILDKVVLLTQADGEERGDKDKECILFSFWDI